MEPQEGQNPGQLLKASISKIQIRQIKTKINIFARATIEFLIGPFIDRLKIPKATRKILNKCQKGGEP